MASDRPDEDDGQDWLAEDLAKTGWQDSDPDEEFTCKIEEILKRLLDERFDALGERLSKEVAIRAEDVRLELLARAERLDQAARECRDELVSIFGQRDQELRDALIKTVENVLDHEKRLQALEAQQQQQR
jgi:hypothetical protein